MNKPEKLLRSCAECPECDGKGYRPLTTEEQNRCVTASKTVCPICGGSGLGIYDKNCPTCDGTGYLKSALPESGKLPCFDCDGTGKSELLTDEEASEAWDSAWKHAGKDHSKFMRDARRAVAQAQLDRCKAQCIQCRKDIEINCMNELAIVY